MSVKIMFRIAASTTSFSSNQSLARVKFEITRIKLVISSFLPDPQSFIFKLAFLLILLVRRFLFSMAGVDLLIASSFGAKY